MMAGGGNGAGRQTISIGPRGIVLPTQNPNADFTADGSRAGGPAGAAGARPNNWSDNHLAPTAAESAALAGDPAQHSSQGHCLLFAQLRNLWGRALPRVYEVYEGELHPKHHFQCWPTLSAWLPLNSYRKRLERLSAPHRLPLQKLLHAVRLVCTSPFPVTLSPSALWGTLPLCHLAIRHQHAPLVVFTACTAAT